MTIYPSQLLIVHIPSSNLINGQGCSVFCVRIIRRPLVRTVGRVHRATRVCQAGVAICNVYNKNVSL